ncbi:sugar-binding protein [Shewanella sp. PP-Sp27a-2]
MRKFPNGYEGFKVTDDKGFKYTFDKLKLVQHDKVIEIHKKSSATSCNDIDIPCGPPTIPGGGDGTGMAIAYKVSTFMLPSSIEDRYGNWVRYEYSGDNLIKIYSNDGRNVSINYTGGNISSISFDGKTVSYEYDSVNVKTLKKVTRPDGKYWEFYNEKDPLKLGGRFWDKSRRGYLESYPMGTDCLKGGFSDEPYIKIKHPDGAVGEFLLRQTYHGRTEVPKMPRDNPNRWNQDLVGYHLPKCVSAFSLTKKKLSNHNKNIEWNYSYSSNDGAFVGEPKQSVANIASIGLNFSALGDLKLTKVVNPDGGYVHHYFSRKLGWEDNQELFIDTYNPNGKIVSVLSNYLSQGQNIGTSRVLFDYSSSAKVKTNKQVTNTYNDDIVSGEYISENLSFNQYDEPVVFKKTNGNTNKSVWFKTIYHHNTSINLLNYPAGIMISPDSVNWSEVNKQDLILTGTGVGRPYRSWIAGKEISNSSYHYDGNLLQITYFDSGRYEKFEDYYRGKARKITLPCATTNGCNTANGSTVNTIIALLEVNSDGTTKSVTDFNGNKTSYTYNPIGWLTKIDYADPKWADKVISYAVVSSLGDGVGGSDVAVGSLRQTISQGNYEKRIYHDGLLRPILTQERDISNPSTTRYQSFAYDHDNRQTLASFPSADASNRIGMETEYDALGRVITLTRTSDGSVSRREYLSGNKVAVTDGENNTATTTYLAYGEPSFDHPTLIEAPDTDDVAIDYNVFGQVTSIRQGSVTDTRIYDAYQQLCKQVRPETGISAFSYNGQRQQIWRAEGTNGSTTACDASAVPATHKVVLSYDNLGQLRTENFPDTTPDKTYSYDGNGNLTSLLAGSVNWTYLYNSSNSIEKETLALDGKNFVLDWEYNNLGGLSSLKYPSGAIVDFAPNALGQATKAGSYASGVSYHPNGQIKQFTYGNGIIRNVALDTTGRIDALTDIKADSVKNSLDPSYDYNDNLARLIDWVDRNNDVDNLTYDGVDRLKSADGKWGSGRYNYDGLGNVLSRSLNNSTITYKYNALNRLNNLTGAYAYGYQYDARGNVTNNGRYSLAYNLGQQMTAAKGISYVYDGHNRRVKQTKTDGSHYTVYSQGGQLLHRQAADGTKTDSVYLGKQLVAEVDNSLAGNPPITGSTPPIVVLKVEATLVGGTCPPKMVCNEAVSSPAHLVTWSSTNATSCTGVVSKSLNGISQGSNLISGIVGSKTYVANGTFYQITLTCTGDGGQTTRQETASGVGGGSDM